MLHHKNCRLCYNNNMTLFYRIARTVVVGGLLTCSLFSMSVASLFAQSVDPVLNNVNPNNSLYGSNPSVNSYTASTQSPGTRSFFGLQKQNLIVCGDFGNSANPTANHECTFADVVTLAKNLVNFAFYLSIPAVILLISYAGYLYMTSAGDEGKVGQAHTIFTNVAIGFCIILAAWLIVTTVLKAVLDQRAYPILNGDKIEIK